MDWFNIHIPTTGRSPEYVGSSPAERGTWLSVMIYACQIECGGRITGAAAWKDRQWQQAAGVTLDEVRAADRLLRFDGNDLLVNGYPVESEKQVRKNRKASRAGAMGKWGPSTAARATRAERLAAARQKGTHTDAEWSAMQKHYGACVRCGATDREIVKDHIVPIYQGGSDGIGNIQPLCRQCNSAKGPESIDWRVRTPAGLPEQWRPTPADMAGARPAAMPAATRHQMPAEGEGEGEGEEEDSKAAAAPPCQPPQPPANPSGGEDLAAVCAPPHGEPAHVTRILDRRTFADWRIMVGKRAFVGQDERPEWMALFAAEGWEEMTKGYEYLAQKHPEPAKLFLSMFQELR